MKYVKIVNLFPAGGGTCDYKGLDINLFVAGKQVYDETVAYIVTEETDLPVNDDLIELTEHEYLSCRQEIENRPRPLNEVERIELMEKAVEDIILNGGVL